MGSVPHPSLSEVPCSGSEEGARRGEHCFLLLYKSGWLPSCQGPRWSFWRNSCCGGTDVLQRTLPHRESRLPAAIGPCPHQLRVTG